MTFPEVFKDLVEEAPSAIAGFQDSISGSNPA
jgi:hypothetical protein